MKNNNLTTLAAIKIFYEDGRSLEKVFENVVLKSLTKTNDSLNGIKKIVNNDSSIDIPFDVLKSILRRLSRSKLVEYSELKNSENKNIHLTDSGKEAKIISMDRYKDADREKNALLQDIKKYIKSLNPNEKYEIAEIEDNFYSFVEENSHDIVLSKNSQKHPTNSNLQDYIFEFINYSEDSNPDSYQRIKDLVFGRILSHAFIHKEVQSNANFDQTVFYLDSNIIFSLLGFHDELREKLTKELITILKNLKMKIKIFSFTKDEVAFKLRKYAESEADNYSKHIAVDSIFYVLKKQGFSKQSVLILVEKLELKLQKDFSIEVDYKYNQEDLIANSSYSPDSLKEYKNISSNYVLKHDFASVEAIRKLRGNRTSSIVEKARFVFVTADSGLSAYSYNFHKHKESKSFPEVIKQEKLASLLWFKQVADSDAISMQSIIINYSRTNIVSHKVWDEFITEVHTLIEKDDISTEDLEMLVAYEETEKALRDTKNPTETISRLLSDKNIKNIKSKQSELEKEIKENVKKKIYLENELGKKNDRNEELTDQLLSVLKKINTKIEADCKAFWSRIRLVIAYICVAIIATITALSLLLLGLPTVADILTMAGFIFVIIAVLMIGHKKDSFSFLKYFFNQVDSVENKFVAKCIIRKKQKINLETNGE